MSSNTDGRDPPQLSSLSPSPSPSPSTSEPQNPENLSLAAQNALIKLRKLQKKYNYSRRREQLRKRASAELHQEHQRSLYVQRATVVKGSAHAAEANTREDQGIPMFWLRAMNNIKALRNKIQMHDEIVLQSLLDIESLMNYDQKKFTLAFHFGPNEYFEDSVIRKCYPLDPENEPIVEKSQGTRIQWKSEGSNDTKEGSKDTKQTRDVTKKRSKKRSRDVESFFNFFKALEVPKDSELREEDAERLFKTIQDDMTVLSAIRDKLIPNAFTWFKLDAYPDVLDENKGAEPEQGRPDILEMKAAKTEKAKEAGKAKVAGKAAKVAETKEAKEAREAEEAEKAKEAEKKHFKLLEKIRLGELARTIAKVNFSKYYMKHNRTEGGQVDDEDNMSHDAEGFWLTALKQNKIVAKEIQEWDEVALLYLKDVRCSVTDEKREREFTLEFHFHLNPFFMDSILSKTYLMSEKNGVLVGATGLKINWCVDIFTKEYKVKPPNKQERKQKDPKVSINISDTRSFFRFFKPNCIPRKNKDSEQYIEDFQGRAMDFLLTVEHDYVVGLAIKNTVIPKAILLYLSKVDRALPCGDPSEMRLKKLKDRRTDRRTDRRIKRRWELSLLSMLDTTGKS